MDYYKVLAKCGHVGKNNYILKWFYLKTLSGKDAAKIVRFKPRVKHYHKDAIREVLKINQDEYINGMKIMTNDMYFKVNNSSEQKLYQCIGIDEVIREDKEKKYKRSRKGQRIKYEILSKAWAKEIQGGLFYD